MGKTKTLLGALALLLVSAPDAGAADVSVLASLSAKAPLDELARIYLARTGDKITVTYETSPALVAAVRRGTRGDVLVASDPEAVGALVAEDLAVGPPVSLAGNVLVVVARAEDTAPVDLAAGLGDGPLVLAPPNHASGRLARQALDRLGLWQRVQGWVVEAPTGQDAVMRVAGAVAPRGIAYRTDALRVPGVRIAAEIPPEAHPPVVYNAVALAAGDGEEARRFLDYLEREAGPVFTRHGFPPAVPTVAITDGAGR